LSPKEIKLKNKPWLSAEILKLIKIRNKVFAITVNNTKKAWEDIRKIVIIKKTSTKTSQLNIVGK
jgi:hypothetical protein